MVVGLYPFAAVKRPKPTAPPMRSTVLVLCVGVALVPLQSLAHPGGLNAQGCHTNHKNGEYHCHTGTSSGGSSGSGSGSIQISPSAAPQPSRSAAKRAAPLVSGPVTLVSVTATPFVSFPPLAKSSPFALPVLTPPKPPKAKAVRRLVSTCVTSLARVLSNSARKPLTVTVAPLPRS